MFDSISFLKTVTKQPGVYCMYDADNKVIYVGKAKNLKKRLTSYFQSKSISRKTEILIKQIKQISITVTHSEKEAMLLEHNYIKRYQPRYNVLLRDDTTYPFLFLSEDFHPRLTMSRTKKNKKGEFFGPFPSYYIVRKILMMMQKIFRVRQCENSIYRNRSRPCLLYQINRCLGPCVNGLVSDEEYMQQVQYMRLFLSGKDDQVITQLIDRMEKASETLAFEKAARLRDQIQLIHQVTEKQVANNCGINDMDVISCAFNFGVACLHVLFIRHGKVLDSRSYFPKVPSDTKFKEVIESFIGQFYLYKSQIRSIPSEIVLDFNLNNKTVLIESLSELIGRNIKVQIKPRGNKTRYLKLARTNVLNALASKLSQQTTIRQRLAMLAALLKLPEIKRMECLDISHVMGEQAVASCVVFDINGPMREKYRRYNITGITPGDDYAAMNQLIQRRYGKEIKKNYIPDVIVIDGGKGHLNQAKKMFNNLKVTWNKNHPRLISLAKSAQRKLELDSLFFELENKDFCLSLDSPALHIIQHIRDEAHRYAITNHRLKRVKKKNTSILESIKGIGPKRRQILLKYMGGLQSLLTSSIEEIAKIPGISQKLAEKIYFSLKH